jgi:serine/threonine protein kinase
MSQPASDESIFLAALEKKSAEERAEFLSSACGADLERRGRIERLLAAHPRVGSFLEEPAVSPPTGPFASQRPEQSELQGTQIGPYKLLQRIGEGGMGAVYLAEQAEPVHRHVALKIIKPDIDSELIIARFEQERQALAMMDHPHIAKVLDGGRTASGRPYFAMELVKGVPITTYCDQRRLPPKKRLELFIPVCHAVQHAHQKGIIHRDLKPSNVLIALYDGQPVPKIIDFGVAKALGKKLTEQTMFTEVGSIVGTLEYMAPEQAELNNLDIDTRADIYSLGVLLYELLTGSPPFTSKQLRRAALTEMLRMIKEVEPPKPSAQLSSSAELPNIAAKRELEPRHLTKMVSGELDWIVMKALEKDRNRRYETANGLAGDLQRYLADEPVQAGPPSAWYRTKKFVHRNKAAVLAGALIFLALTGGLIGTTWGLHRAVRERDEKEQARKAEFEQRQRAEQNEKRADLQAAIAVAINEFLQDDVLRLADSRRQGSRGMSPDPNLTVKEAVRRAAERIEDRFHDKPQLEAAIRQAIGDALCGMGEARRAVPHMERALEIREAQLGSHDRETLLTMNNLASALREAGRPKEGTVLHERTLQRRKEAFGMDDRDTLVSMNNLAVAYRQSGRLAEAERLNRECWDRRKRVLGADHALTLSSLLNLAYTRRKTGKVGEAIPMFEEVVGGYRAKLGGQHPWTIVSMGALADAYRDAGRLDEAVRLHEEAEALARATFGPDHPDTVIHMNNLALAYRDAGRLDEALPLCEQVLDFRRAHLRPRHPHTLGSLTNLAALYSYLGYASKAEPLMEEAWKGMSELRGPHHLETQHYLKSLEQIRTAKEVTKPYEESLAKNGPDHADTLAARRQWALRLLEKDVVRPAAYHLRVILDARRRQFGPDNADTLISQTDLGMALIRQSNHAEAESLLLNAYDRWTGKALEPQADKERLRTLEQIVELYDKWERKTKADEWRAKLPRP